MRYIFFFLLGGPLGLFAQVETVVLPLLESSSPERVFPVDRNIGSHVVVDPERLREGEEIEEDTPQVEVDLPSRGEGLGAREEDPGLSEVVAEINADYQEAEERCLTGSWLARLWCRMKAWVGG